MSEKVLAGKPKASGGLYTAPAGSPLPTDVGTALDATFIAPLIVSDEGVTCTTEKNSTNWLKWGGTTVRKVTTDGRVFYTLTVIETSFESLTVIYGPDNVSRTAGGNIHVRKNLTDPPVLVYIFEMLDGATELREVVARGQVLLTGDVVYNPENPIGYELEIEALDDGTGDLAHLYITDADGVPAG